VLHLFFGTIATFLAGILVRAGALTFSHRYLGSAPWFTSDVASFAPWFVAVGLAAGYTTFSRIGGKSAFFIFVLPCSILILKILTFPASSIFASGLNEGWKYFFGSVRCSSTELLSLADTAIQCQRRLIYFGVCIGSVAYSIGAITKHLGILGFRRSPES
jgi:hypothetical protein